MKTRVGNIILWSGALMLLAGNPRAGADGVAVGQPAPDFTLTDTRDHTWSLAEFKGRFIVLEWFNPECPFTLKHYRSGNMPRLQTRATQHGVIWLSIDSSAPGKQGAVSPQQANAFMQQHGAAPSHVFLDPTGTVGKLYGAKTTPHLFLIDPKGMVIYNGAIDDRPSANPADVVGANNYVQQALDEAMAGQPVSTPTTPPYGCSVKY